jgi:hypothetical protein
VGQPLSTVEGNPITMEQEHWTWWLFAGLFLSAVLLLVGRFAVTKSIMGGDAVYYYISLRSLVVDYDLDFQNEYAYFSAAVSPFTGNKKIAVLPSQHPVTGRLPNKYPLGSVLLLVPFFAVVHAYMHGDGYGAAYQIAAGLGSLIYGFLGVLLVYRLGKRYAPQSAFAMTVGIWLATPLIYYMIMEPLMSHSCSMFLATAFVSLWLGARKQPTLYHWAFLGGLAGVMTMTRYQDGLFALILALYTGLRLRHPGQALGGLLLFALAGVIGFAPQLYANTLLYGTPLTTGYTNEGFFYWTAPKLIFTLFSSACGLVLWAPIMALSFLGLGYLVRREIGLALPLWMTFLVQWYLVSSWSVPGQGDTFGNRMLLNSTVIFAIGLNEFLAYMYTRPLLRRTACGLIGVFIALNGILAGLYCFRVIGHPY